MLQLLKGQANMPTILYWYRKPWNQYKANLMQKLDVDRKIKVTDLLDEAPEMKEAIDWYNFAKNII